MGPRHRLLGLALLACCTLPLAAHGDTELYEGRGTFGLGEAETPDPDSPHHQARGEVDVNAYLELDELRRELRNERDMSNRQMQILHAAQQMRDSGAKVTPEQLRRVREAEARAREELNRHADRARALAGKYTAAQDLFERQREGMIEQREREIEQEREQAAQEQPFFSIGGN